MYMYHKCNVLVRSLHKLNIAHTPYIAYHTCNINIAISQIDHICML